MSGDSRPKPLKLLEVDLFASIYQLAAEHEWSAEKVEALITKARGYLNAYAPEPAKWDGAPYRRVSEMFSLDLLGKVVKLRATISFMSEPLMVWRDDFRTQSVILTFRDPVDGCHISSMALTWSPLIEKVRACSREHTFFDVLGSLYALPLDESGAVCAFRVLVYDIRPSSTPLQMLMASQDEISAARELLETLKSRQESVIDFVFTEVTRTRSIQGLEQAVLLRDSIRFVILQAASCGSVFNASGKLHSLIIGAPAVGKKLIRDVCKELNPAFQEAHPSKVTAAGISATAYFDKAGWHSKPGYIPLAHEGVLAIQDFHSVVGQRPKIEGILSMAMEDGVVEDSTAAQTSFLAQTSIHLDLNKVSDLSPQLLIKPARLDDIKIRMHLLSRFDFVVDIERDTARQIAVALSMYDALVSTRMRVTERSGACQLRILIAYLRTAHAEVNFPVEVRGYMKAKHSELMDNNRPQLARLPWLSDFQTRTTVSIAKFTAAAARLADRSEAHKDDVDLVLPFVARKYEFLQSFQSGLVVPPSWSGRRALRDRRTQWILETFVGRESVRVTDIITAARRASGLNETLEHKAVYRILEDLMKAGVIRKPRHGFYDFTLVGKMEGDKNESDR